MNNKITNSLFLSLISLCGFAQQNNKVDNKEAFFDTAFDDVPSEQIKINPVDIESVLRYGTHNQAKKYYYDTIRNQAENGRLFYNMGQIMLAENKSDSAKYFFDKGVRKSWEFAINNLGYAKLAFKNNKLKEGNSKINALTALTVNPTAQLYVDIAKTYLDYKTGDIEKAKSFASLASEMDPSNIEARLVEGDAYLKEGQKNIAELIYRKTMKANPTNVEAKLRLAKIYRKENTFIKAISLYEEAIELNPKHPDARRDLALIYQDYAGFSNKTSYLKKASDSYTTFYELFESCVGVDNQYADFLIDINDYDRLNNWVEKKWSTRGDNFKMYRYAAVASYEQGFKQQAYLFAYKYFDVYKDNPEEITAVDDFYFGLGKIAQAVTMKKFNKQDFDSGILNVKKGVKGNLKLSDAIYRNGLDLFKKGLYEQAYYVFKNGTESEDTKFYIENQYYTGVCLFQSLDKKIVDNQLVKSREAFAKAIEKSPNSHESHLMYARVNREINTPQSLSVMYDSYKTYLSLLKKKKIYNSHHVKRFVVEAQNQLSRLNG